MKMLHCGAISGNIDRSKALAASAGGAPGSGATVPLHDLNVPYDATTEEYATPTANMLFPPTPLQTLIQTPLPGTDAGMYNIPTGPSDYAPSPISDVRNRMAMNGADSKTDRTSPYMRYSEALDILQSGALIQMKHGQPRTSGSAIGVENPDDTLNRIARGMFGGYVNASISADGNYSSPLDDDLVLF